MKDSVACLSISARHAFDCPELIRLIQGLFLNRIFPGGVAPEFGKQEFVSAESATHFSPAFQQSRIAFMFMLPFFQP